MLEKLIDIIVMSVGEMAVEAVLSSKVELKKKASKQLNVPKSTQERHVNKAKNNPDYKVDKLEIQKCFHSRTRR